MAYPNAAEVKEYVGSASAADDTLIARLMVAAQGYIEGKAAADRRFAVTTDTTRYFDAVRDVSTDKLTLTLDEDLYAITSVTNGDGAVLSASDYSPLPRNAPPYRKLRMKFSTTAPIWQWQTSPEDAIVIVGKWGYSATPPEDIAYAYKALIKYFYNRRSTAGDADRGMAADGILIIPSQVPKDIQGILKGYRFRWLS